MYRSELESSSLVKTRHFLFSFGLTNIMWTTSWSKFCRPAIMSNWKLSWFGLVTLSRLILTKCSIRLKIPVLFRPWAPGYAEEFSIIVEICIGLLLDGVRVPLTGSGIPGIYLLANWFVLSFRVVSNSFGGITPTSSTFLTRQKAVLNCSSLLLVVWSNSNTFRLWKSGYAAAMKQLYFAEFF